MAKSLKRKVKRNRSSRHKRSLHRRRKHVRKTKRNVKKHKRRTKRHHKRHIKKKRRRRSRRHMRGGNPLPLNNKAGCNQPPASTNINHQHGGGMLDALTPINLGLGMPQTFVQGLTDLPYSLYNEWNGENTLPSSDPMYDQPIGKKANFGPPELPNISQAYDSGAKQAASYTLNNQ